MPLPARDRIDIKIQEDSDNRYLNLNPRKRDFKLQKIILFIAVVLFSILLVTACDSKTALIKKPLCCSASPFVWSPDARCLDCHPTEVNSMANPALLASKHSVAEKSCLDCHDIADLQKAHKNIDAKNTPSPLQKYSSAICFNCHGSYTDIIELTKGKTRLNPHDSHYGEIDCFICHKIHTAKSPDEFCVSCHI
ncbi:MAG: cytochrome c3 family protein [Proteobacteria bacterium]|nr:cytochrome c3 family protein [Pseudomonadota bacterium]